jgi:hypothetical protein
MFNAGGSQMKQSTLTQRIFNLAVGFVLVVVAGPAFSQDVGDPTPPVVKATWQDTTLQQVFRVERKASEASLDFSSTFSVRGLVSCDTLGKDISLLSCLQKTIQKAEEVAEEQCLARGQVAQVPLVAAEKQVILRVTSAQAGSAVKHYARASVLRFCSK